mgnify:CR=1 FL=1
MLQGKDSAIQRIQVGLLGIVAVLLFVSLASVVLERAAQGDLARGGGASLSPNNGGQSSPKVADEPLAELGAAPVVENDAATQKKPAGKGKPAAKDRSDVRPARAP